MAEHADEPGQDPQTPQQANQPSMAHTPAQPAPPPFKHTRWQRLIRNLYQLYGPAQTGLPPYATPEEREAWRRGNRPQPKGRKPAPPPPGYQITEYRDGQGYVHRSLVPITPPEAARKQPGSIPTDEPPTDPTVK